MIDKWKICKLLCRSIFFGRVRPGIKHDMVVMMKKQYTFYKVGGS